MVAAFRLEARGGTRRIGDARLRDEDVWSLRKCRREMKKDNSCRYVCSARGSPYLNQWLDQCAPVRRSQFP